MLSRRSAPSDVGAGRGDGGLESKVEVSESVEPVFALSASSSEPCSACFEATSDDAGLSWSAQLTRRACVFFGFAVGLETAMAGDDFKVSVV